ncbi:MAG: hypothetical protein LBU87_01150 [Lactobacillales bacterium]|jgi:hypothetical protein|nr:hypothetical protein [Lactobacillales bacterium]
MVKYHLNPLEMSFVLQIALEEMENGKQYSTSEIQTSWNTYLEDKGESLENSFIPSKLMLEVEELVKNADVKTKAALHLAAYNGYFESHVIPGDFTEKIKNNRYDEIIAISASFPMNEKAADKFSEYVANNLETEDTFKVLSCSVSPGRIFAEPPLASILGREQLHRILDAVAKEDSMTCQRILFIMDWNGYQTGCPADMTTKTFKLLSPQARFEYATHYYGKYDDKATYLHNPHYPDNNLELVEMLNVEDRAPAWGKYEIKNGKKTETAFHMLPDDKKRIALKGLPQEDQKWLCALKNHKGKDNKHLLSNLKGVLQVGTKGRTPTRPSIEKE